MPSWLQVASTIVAAFFTIGVVARGVATWVWTVTIKRDLARINEQIAELHKRIDDYDGSEIWGEVQTKVGGIEIDQRLLKQSVEFVSSRLTTLESNFNAMRERRRNDDYNRKNS